jgi:hypothetical protein
MDTQPLPEDLARTPVGLGGLLAVVNTLLVHQNAQHAELLARIAALEEKAK